MAGFLRHLKQGRKPVLSAPQVTGLIKRMRKMIKKAKGKYEVPLKKLKRATRTKASRRTIQRKFHERKVKFRNMREKPILTDQDPCANLFVLCSVCL